MMIPRVWGPIQFRAYLNIYHNINLDDYLDPFFNRDILIMSPQMALQSKSDVDGDLAPLMIPNAEGQILAIGFVNKTVTEAEQIWLANYAKKEYESDKKLNLNGTPNYTLHPLSFVFHPNPVGDQDKNYPQYILNATIAKGNIGGSTIDCWLIKLLIQCYNARYNQTGGRVYDQDRKQIGKMKFKLTEHDVDYLSHIYVRLVQERVVEGIKHVQGGSTAFQIYFLDNITKASNKEIVKQQLENDFDVPPVMVAKLLNVIEYCIYDRNILLACNAFIKKYNKGKLPRTDEQKLALDTWESFIQTNTYFGSLVQPLFDVQQRIQTLSDDVDAQTVDFESLFGAGTQSLTVNSNEDSDDSSSGFDISLF